MLLKREWAALEAATADRYRWDDQSTYVRNPPYFEGLTREPEPVGDITGARVLAVLGDSVTTDHIPPAGAIRPDSSAGRWLIEHGVDPDDFNSYGSRRGNHEVMLRGTFANPRLRNRLAPGTRAASPCTCRTPPRVDLRRRNAVPGRGHRTGRARRQESAH